MLSDDECRELLQRYHATRDPRVHERLVIEHEWMAQRCAKRFAGRGEPHADLVQVGRIALVKAIERFDPEHGGRFASFALPTVLGELRRHFRDATWAVKVPRRLKDLTNQLATTRERLSQELGRPPLVDEIADAMALAPDVVLEVIEANQGYRTASIDATTVSDSSGTPSLLDQLGMDDAELAGADLRISTSEALARLDERSRSVVVWTFYEGRTQSEIGERLGVGQVQVSRLLRGALHQLRRHLIDDQEGGS